jgi:hypothetical protein
MVRLELATTSRSVGCGRGTYSRERVEPEHPQTRRSPAPKRSLGRRWPAGARSGWRCPRSRTPGALRQSPDDSAPDRVGMTTPSHARGPAPRRRGLRLPRKAVAVGVTCVVAVLAVFTVVVAPRLAADRTVQGQIFASQRVACTGVATPTVVLSNGLGADNSDNWDEVVSEVSRTTRVCVVDRPGSDGTPNRPAGDDSPQDDAELLRASLTEAGVPDPTSTPGGPTAVRWRRWPPSTIGRGPAWC